MPVAKRSPDGTVSGCRLTVDLTKLNRFVKRPAYPVRSPHDAVASIGSGANFYTKLDSKSGYHQIPMVPSDRVKTSFTCRYGTYQFTVMPFGLSTAPATFQRMMNTIFFELLDRGVLVYLDDVLIYTKTVEEHIKLLDDVFALL